MSELVLTKIRRNILQACQDYHGAPESKWSRNSLDQKAIDFLVEQQLLDRRLSDGSRAMIWRLYLTERGRAALRGDLITKITPPIPKPPPAKEGIRK